MGGHIVKNWSPRDVISFLKKNGFVELKKSKGDHCCLFNSETKAYTEVDKGRDAFTAREMLGFIEQTQIPKEFWIKGKKARKLSK
ncbi:hypothetical protein KKG82_00295 [Patescibacteria group bacterium]|nr:hypothetical protein [Patescibacteria group bacterium]